MFFDITDFIEIDEAFNYFLISKEKNTILNKLTDYINNDGLIFLPKVSEILQEAFPFLINNNLKIEVVNKSIELSNCVNKMIFNSIKNRKSKRLFLEINFCKNLKNINLAKKMITEINSFIYKYNIQKIYSQKTFVYLNFDSNFIGTIDLILQNEEKIFIMDIKTSKVNFIEKYIFQLFLHKKMFEYSSNLKVEDCLILNPRENQVLMKYSEPIKKEQSRISTLINNLLKEKNEKN
ncbi:PD-(D/E)XK nuclease family protein [Spiroplasma taiwanense]|uniref:PD-(D/E)XK endonuclease-like domain-containing protein n=1 Tax=Spiroplasma taiwanense CT-1 TaxID=1276220 RepID=S5LV18_9MOLU|nr:hypothetical protein [Spiroplasma taiwanense]AGR41639.1 hypothetical protein STAIW_v1c10560 [Spiroplasma taiwanense CT-1]